MEDKEENNDDDAEREKQNPFEDAMGELGSREQCPIPTPALKPNQFNQAQETPQNYGTTTSKESFFGCVLAFL